MSLTTGVFYSRKGNGVLTYVAVSLPLDILLLVLWFILFTIYYSNWLKIGTLHKVSEYQSWLILLRQ